MFLSLQPLSSLLVLPQGRGEAIQEEILVKMTNQRHQLTKRLRLHWNIIEHFPTWQLMTTSMGFQYNNNRLQLKGLQETDSF